MTTNKKVSETDEYVKELVCECGELIVEDQVISDGEKVECPNTECKAVYEFEWVGMTASVQRR